MTKEDIKQICQIYDNFRSERDAATIAYNSDDTFWEHILATYNLSQPSLPSNLDDAAHHSAVMVLNSPAFLPNTPFSEILKILDGLFKAGAEWMAGQGVTKEAVIGMATEEISINVSQQTLDKLDLCPGDKVVVQIRKK